MHLLNDSLLLFCETMKIKRPDDVEQEQQPADKPEAAAQAHGGSIDHDTTTTTTWSGAQLTAYQLNLLPTYTRYTCNSVKKNTPHSPRAAHAHL